MKKMCNLALQKLFPIFFSIFIFKCNSWAQTLPFIIQNNSPFPDSVLFVAVVGQDLLVPSNFIWIDCKTSTQLPMSPVYNTVSGPVLGGNSGPGGNGKYANCFTRLSDIPNKTVNLPKIQGCRMYISTGQQMYFYFFGSSGASSGYSSPSATNPTDPNTGIRYELVECTNGTNGFFGNTSRVDAYQYPMGLELYGTNYYKKIGELKTHDEIVDLFKSSVPKEFQNCLDVVTGVIHAPSKIKDFADGSGIYKDYMKPYVDQIWTKYALEDLYFDADGSGTWKGRVQGEQMILTCVTGVFAGRKGIINQRPTTQEIFEGKGVLALVVQDATTDLFVQAQLCAALNRRCINITTTNIGLQKWNDPSTYYFASPTNFYSKFWHQSGVSVDNIAYGFAYDDVYNQSSTINTLHPTKVVATYGGFAPPPATLVPTVSQTSLINNFTFNFATKHASIQTDGFLDADTHIRIFDIALGRELFSTTLLKGCNESQLDMDLSKYSAGLYLFSITNHQLTINKKVMVRD